MLSFRTCHDLQDIPLTFIAKHTHTHTFHLRQMEQNSSHSLHSRLHTSHLSQENVKKRKIEYIFTLTGGWGEGRSEQIDFISGIGVAPKRTGKKERENSGKLASTPGAKLLFADAFFKVSHSLSFEMEAVKFVALLLLVVAVQVFGALGFSSDEEDGEVWMVQNWKVKLKCNFSFFVILSHYYFFFNWDKCEWRRDFTHDFYARFYARSGARCAVTSQRFLAIYD